MSIISSRFSRRALLRSAGASAALWPVLRSTSAFANEVPKRVVVIFTPNSPQFVIGPTEGGGSETQFNLHPWWSPLQRHKGDGVYFRGVYQAGVPFGEHSELGHRSGLRGALTAAADEGNRSRAPGPSIDQFIGQELERQGVVMPKRALTWGLFDRREGPFFEAPGQEVSPLSNPYDALAQIAPSFPQAEGINPLARKHFLLDQVAASCRRLQRELDADGRQLLDFHCANVESLEASVRESLEGTSASCAPPSGPISSLGPDADWTGREQRDDAMRAFTDLMALAFACDVTRVVGIGLGGYAERFTIPESYGVPSSGRVNSGDSGPQMHAWTHQPPDHPDAQRALEIFFNWFSEKVAAVLDKLKSTRDADGRPLFDSTLVLWTTEYGGGRGGHYNGNVPVMMFGNSMGQFRTGRNYDVENELQNDSDEERALVLHRLFVSIMRHAGLGHVDRFGNAGRGPLDWLA